MKITDLANHWQRLEKTDSRNQITELLAKLFKKVSAMEIDKVCYLSLGELAPKYEGVEFNLAEKMMVRALAQAAGKENGEVTKLFKSKGDLGEVAQKLLSGQKSTLKVVKVYDRLVKIAQENGSGSQKRKLQGMAQLLKDLDQLSAKYVARIPVKKLRLGFSDLTVLDALSWMKKGDKSLRPELERAFNVAVDVGKLAQRFKKGGLSSLKKVKPEVGVPIRAAKATALSDHKKILEKMNGKTALEPKYDGFRVQIHIDKSRKFELKEEQNLSLFKEDKYFVRIFSRNLDNMTHMFPEIVTAAQKLKVKKAILDGEAIAVDKKTGKFLPFQETVQRKRKHGVGKKAKEIPLRVFVFDLLYLNGKPLLGRPFVKRRQQLVKILPRPTDTLVLTEQKVVDQDREFAAFFKEMVKDGLEGLMAKKLDAAYQAGARNFIWIKYKVGMKSELADTIDCVVMGYYRGRGKRNKFGIGAFLVGVPDGKGKFVTVSKIGTGLTDKQWREIHRRCEKLKANKKPKEYQVDKNLAPDVWCGPSLVVEIEADTITKSPIHTAGLALRFPRLKKFRDDKDPEQATSLKRLRKLA